MWHVKEPAKAGGSDVCKKEMRAMKQRDVSVWQEERAKEFCEEWYKTQVKKDHKIVVIDDDPTGTQTVHDVPVYTAYDLEHIRKGFKEETPLFYVLTNSRSLKEKETEKLHLQLGRDIAQAAKESGKTCTVISRGDSTLRGHYPLETQCLKQAMEEISGEKIDGEIIAPFFLEGGRITAGDIHYVVQKDGEMVPAGETEFAKDMTFSYHASDLKKWIEEKTAGKVKEEDVLSFSLEDLRNGTPEKIADRLEDVCDFGKVIVNAVCYEDMIAFARGYELALERGKRFIFRSAAAVPKVLGRITDQPLLTRRDMIREKTKAGGLIVAGSHVKKTTDQLKCLLEDKNRAAVEFNQHLILDHEKMENEFSRVMGLVNQFIEEGRTTVVYTRRERLDLNTGNAEDELKVATDISRYLTRIVEELKVKPAFIVAKGGITSSDIGVKGLKISRGWVLGQIRPGIPVWEADENSRFPGIPYVVFPGNVGNEEDLKKVAEIMEAKKKPIVAVLLGDGSGVGPELVVKLADKGVLASCGKPLILGNVKLWEKAVAEFAPGLKWQQVEKAEEADWFKGIPVLSVGEQEPDRFTIGQVNEVIPAALGGVGLLCQGADDLVGNAPHGQGLAQAVPAEHILVEVAADDAHLLVPLHVHITEEAPLLKLVAAGRLALFGVVKGLTDAVHAGVIVFVGAAAHGGGGAEVGADGVNVLGVLLRQGVHVVRLHLPVSAVRVDGHLNEIDADLLKLGVHILLHAIA